MDYQIIHGNCMDAMRELLAKGVQVDSIVTDPPYELGFMGKEWDRTGIAYQRLMWRMCFDLLKPGGHLISFGGSRTYHRMACAIEDAGFEVRDQIMWLYGQGFPKSQDVSKAIDKMAGAEREIGALKFKGGTQLGFINDDSWVPKDVYESYPATESAKQWQGFGSALKPAHEPIVLARKPLSEKTIAENVLKHGTGAINIDGCRVPHDGNIASANVGRFPANLIHDGSYEVECEFAKYGEKKTGAVKPYKLNGKQGYNGNWGEFLDYTKEEDTGTASRFFYCAKASKKERNGSKHPTVKPISLIRYLCRLITPPRGTILDPFAGSGTTGQAAIEEGFKIILIEKEDEYLKDIENRLMSYNPRMEKVNDHKQSDIYN